MIVLILLVALLFVSFKWWRAERKLKRLTYDATEDTIFMDFYTAMYDGEMSWKRWGLEFKADDSRALFRQMVSFAKAYPSNVAPPTDEKSFTRVREVIQRYENVGLLT